MSALPPKADIHRHRVYVRLVPIADGGNASTRSLRGLDPRELYSAFALNALVAEDKMEKLIDLFCHAMRITDPLSIKIAVGMVGGGIPLLFLSALFVWLGELATSRREAEMTVLRRPARRKGRAARKSPAVT
jgi:hypothetical protein